ncbi:DUF3857 domain-containing protein [Aquimarina gracilis]|uniref:DUF3857 domain-containing protein n=1 Tax=Aquimarina gracilis TaxID=874422 RepID=A0ABU5ZU32_9FLAO|nr:DUF3857 domain-containing protein [Aquimarina gracilis]MEB3345570.1 DUF3857 domain-containing protein [Aquimarina gracilis]
MIKNLIVIGLLLISPFTSAQKTYNSTNMVVSLADLHNNNYVKDSTANAVFIYEKGHSRIENGRNYNLLTDYEAKVKIFNKQGFDKATVRVFLYKNSRDKELFRNLTAFTHNLENGKITKVKLQEQHIYKEEYDENHNVVNFTFPNVKPGSVITYKYQLESPFIYKFNGWEFQDDIPKLYSEFIADMPGNYLYHAKLIGPFNPEKREEKLIKRCIEVPGGGHSDCSHIVYFMKDIPAFKEEQYMTAKKNYFSRIDYELKEYKGFDGTTKKYTETWKNVDSKLAKEPNIGLQLKKLGITKNLLPDSIQSMPNTLPKAKSIYKHFTFNYKWNGNYDIFKDDDQSRVKKVIEDKIGNVSGINILFHNTLKQQGFNVKSVLLATREKGYATKLYPVISDFNYLIVQLTIDNKTYFLDATENTLQFGEVPFRCLNQYGRLLDFDNGSSWTDIRPSQRSSSYFRESLTFNSELYLEGKADHIFSGYNAYFKRKKLDQIDIEKYIDQIEKINHEIEVSNVSLSNIDKLDKPYKEEFNFIRKVEEIEGVVYIKPFLRPFFKENPFKLNERTYPVDFGYTDSYNYYVSIELPENYEFNDLPKSSRYTIPNELGDVITSYEINGKKLVISHRIIFGSSYYPTEYYSGLKEFFDLIVEIENNTLITVKKVF